MLPCRNLTPFSHYSLPLWIRTTHVPGWRSALTWSQDCWCSTCVLLCLTPTSPPEEGRRWVGVEWVSYLLRWWISPDLSNNPQVTSLQAFPYFPALKKSSFTLFCLYWVHTLCINVSIGWLEALISPKQPPFFMPQ